MPLPPARPTRYLAPCTTTAALLCAAHAAAVTEPRRRRAFWSIELRRLLSYSQLKQAVSPRVAVGLVQRRSQTHPRPVVSLTRILFPSGDIPVPENAFGWIHPALLGPLLRIQRW